ncbi:MAG: IS1634 family transposase [Desulfomonilia bacterium]|nr:IS1634 family transposase [Desulfomonilia bacterium]
MFARIKKSGRNEYLQIVENHREGKRVTQRVIATLGRLDDLKSGTDIQALARSLARFSEQTLMVLTGKSEVDADAVSIGPALVFERLWKELHIDTVLEGLLKRRKFGFDVERAVFMTVLHRLFASGSDRSCDRWRRDCLIPGTKDLSLHHLYRGMAFLGGELQDQKGSLPCAPRCIKDLIEEGIFSSNRDLFTGMDLVFFDTTSIYFEGEGGDTLGEYGHSKDSRPDLKQMVVGAVIDDTGRPVSCEMMPGDTADVTTLVPVSERIRSRFGIGEFCVVADRGMISARTLTELEEKGLSYILGVRMRRVRKVSEEVLSRPGRYHEVPTGDKEPLKVKEVVLEGRRFIVCLNEAQARKDELDRQMILDSLKNKLKQGPKALVGNKGYRRFLSVESSHVRIDEKKVAGEARFDGKWVLETNTKLTAEEVALKYKELWQVEQVFRDMKSVLDTRPVYHQRDETIRGHVFCSFLALVLIKELISRLENAGCSFAWADIRRDLEALREVSISESGKSLVVRSRLHGVSGKVLQTLGIGIPPTIRELPA